MKRIKAKLCSDLLVEEASLVGAWVGVTIESLGRLASLVKKLNLTLLAHGLADLIMAIGITLRKGKEVRRARPGNLAETATAGICGPSLEFRSDGTLLDRDHGSGAKNGGIKPQS